MVILPIHFTRKKDPEPIRSAISLSVLIFQGEKGVVLEIFFSDVVALGGVDIGVAGEFGDGFNPGAVFKEITNHRSSRGMKASALVELKSPQCGFQKLPHTLPAHRLLLGPLSFNPREEVVSWLFFPSLN